MWPRSPPVLVNWQGASLRPPGLLHAVFRIYENQSNDIIIFNCYKNTESMNLQIGQQGTLLQEVYVGDIPADLYIDSMEDNITGNVEFSPIYL